jgi:hypothetical protein
MDIRREWCAWQESNLLPLAPQASALARGAGGQDCNSTTAGPVTILLRNSGCYFLLTYLMLVLAFGTSTSQSCSTLPGSGTPQ